MRLLSFSLRMRKNVSYLPLVHKKVEFTHPEIMKNSEAINISMSIGGNIHIRRNFRLAIS